MAQRHVHYEAAFEDYVRSRGWPYVPVNERRKAIFSGDRVKSFDFMVYRPGAPVWLADVKGRKFPYDTAGGAKYWENWVPEEDLQSLMRWNNAFGDGFQAVLVFVYWVSGVRLDGLWDALHTFRNRQYAMLWVSVVEYAALTRNRSSRWRTLDVPTAAFRRLLRPINAA